MTDTQRRPDDYWPTREGRSLTDSVMAKVEAFRRYCVATGLVSKWARMSQAYFGMSPNGSATSHGLTARGITGDLVAAKPNDYRTLIQRQVGLATQQRPAGQAKAINTDSKSRHSARIASSLSEFYLSQQGFEDRLKASAERSLACDESWVEVGYDATLGKAVRPDDSGKILMEGDLFLRVHMPWNVARDVLAPSLWMPKWFITSHRVPRYDLVAQYPERADEILNAAARDRDTLFRLPLSWGQDSLVDSYDSDYVTVYELHAEESPALAGGRYALIIPGCAPLLESGYPYPRMGLAPMYSGSLFDGPFGYSSSSDLLGLEELTDNLFSIVATNQLALGGNVIVGPTGAGINHSQFSDALSYLEADPAAVDKIRTLDLLRTSPEIFNFLNLIYQRKLQTTGLNEVAMGQIEGALRGASGAALALIQAAAIQANSNLQSAYYGMLSRTMSLAIDILRSAATVERVVQIAGKANTQFAKEFRYTGEDLGGFSSIVYEPVNPLSQTTAGRLATAESLMDRGMLKSPKQYFSVLQTGNLDTLISDDFRDQDCILSENERLLEGQPHRALATENHSDHIRSHMSVLSSPEAKDDEELVTRVLAAIEEHTTLWQDLSMTNPTLLIATGQQVLPVGPPGMPGGMPGEAPPQPGAMPSGATAPPATEVMAPGAPAMPSMPTNPLTGEKAPEPSAPF